MTHATGILPRYLPRFLPRFVRRIMGPGASPVPRRRSSRRLAGTLALCLGLVGALLAPQAARAALITIDTTLLSGVAARLDFALVDQDGAANNTVTLSGFSTNGTLDASSCVVGCSGGPPFVLDDAGGLAQFLQDLTLGSFVQFDLSYTANFAGGLADVFALNLLNPDTNLTLVTTDLGPPIFNDVLLLLSLRDGGVLDRPSVLDPAIGISAAPEPGSFALAALALLALAMRRRAPPSRRL